MNSPPLSNSLRRTFCLKVGESCGSAFSVPVGTTHVFVTAKHVVENFQQGHVASVGLYTGSDFEDISVIPYFCEGGVDIAILLVGPGNYDEQTNIGPELSSDGLTLGQDSFFLGFPYFGAQLSYVSTEINGGFPIPFAKKATVSAFHPDILYLDGHNNPGFSGGPVIFNHPSGAQKICAVVSGYVPHVGEVSNVPTVSERVRPLNHVVAEGKST